MKMPKEKGSKEGMVAITIITVVWHGCGGLGIMDKGKNTTLVMKTFLEENT